MKPVKIKQVNDVINGLHLILTFLKHFFLDSVQKTEADLQQHSEVVYHSVDMHQQYVPQSVVIESSSSGNLSKAQNETGKHPIVKLVK